MSHYSPFSSCKSRAVFFSRPRGALVHRSRPRVPFPSGDSHPALPNPFLHFPVCRRRQRASVSAANKPYKGDAFTSTERALIRQSAAAARRSCKTRHCHVRPSHCSVQCRSKHRHRQRQKQQLQYTTSAPEDSHLHSTPTDITPPCYRLSHK